MILRDVHAYMQTHRRATLGDISLHFGLSPDAMRGMLEQWIRKGRIRQLTDAATCNRTCPLSCDDTAMVIYEVVDPAPSAAVRHPRTLLPMLSQELPSCRQSDRLAHLAKRQR